MVRADFQITTHLFLSYPKKFYNEYEGLTSFYDKLIEIIPNEIHQFIIVATKEVSEDIKNRFKHKNLDTLIVKHWDEIWLRDCMGLSTESEIIKPIYYPNYCNLKQYWNYFKQINKLSKQIIKESLSKEIVDMPLILDCGNFINNSSIAFLTGKVLADNPGINVVDMINNYCNIKPIIVGINKNDSIGHIDGYMAFLNETSVFISEYPKLKYLETDIEYITSLKSVASDNGLMTMPIYDFPISEKGNCGCKDDCWCFYSAKGTYVNFLQLNNTIILPEYSISKRRSRINYNEVNQKLLIDKGFNVILINCDEVAKFGGALHCLSWQV